MTNRWFAPAILLAAIFGWAGAIYGPDWQWLHDVTYLLQTAFLAALKMVIAPLIFFSLMSGVMQLRASGRMGRLGGVMVLYYATTSAFAILIGLVVVFFIHPWTELAPFAADYVPSGSGDVALIAVGNGGLVEVVNNLLQMMLVNPFTALAELNILGILTSALLLGLAAALVLPTNSTIPAALQDLTEVTFRLASWVIATLPLGLFAIAYQLADKIQLETIYSLGQFAAVVFGATALHGLIILPGIAWLLTGTNPKKFFAATAQPLFTALVTSSSAATLPLSLAAAENKLGVDRAKAAFVLPLGATVNMDGTALFEGIAVIFLAYMFSVPMDTSTIFIVFFVAMLASAGAPGIPSGSMAGLQVVLLAVGIPLEAIALLLLIERPLDTFRTAVNVEGDLVGCLVAQRWA